MVADVLIETTEELHTNRVVQQRMDYTIHGSLVCDEAVQETTSVQVNNQWIPLLKLQH